MNSILRGDCRMLLPELADESVDMVYFDPPFFTQKTHSFKSRVDAKVFEFEDRFDSLDDYLQLIEAALTQSKRVLKTTGSVFLHCDKTASHSIRVVMDKVFGRENFQSEIVWSYKRWSNSKKGLLNAHQIIFFYSKTADFKFNTIYTDYSATTNIDQIVQERQRDVNGKSVYKRDVQGNVVIGKGKKGVPLSDVWEIPFLNPKAKERTGYPTQKPVLLLNQLIRIATDEGDVVLDPFCGSGTTCVAAKLLNRKFMGIDASADAVALATSRLQEMVVTESELVKKGADSFVEKTEKELAILQTINAFPVHRNAGIDGFLREQPDGAPVPVKIQAEWESLDDAVEKLERASLGKGYSYKIVVQTKEAAPNRIFEIDSHVEIIKSLELQARERGKKRNLIKTG